jgi:tetratricopeptide (TPR) repeat protein
MLTLAESFNPQFALAWGWRVRVQLLWRGDIEKAQALVKEAGQVQGLQDAVGLVALEAFRNALIARDFHGALRLLEGERRPAFYTQFYYRPLDLLRGEAHLLAGETAQARVSFEAGRRRLQELTTKDPEDPRFLSALGIACAGLGLGEEALQAANRAAELMPPEKDRWKAMSHISDLALVNAMLGRQDEAIDKLDYLLTNTGEMSTHLLRLDPRWQGLKSSPRFQALLAKHGDPPR